MCVARGDGGGRLRSALISMPGSGSTSLLGPSRQMLPTRSSLGTGHTCQCPQQERAHRCPHPKSALWGAAVEHPVLHTGISVHPHAHRPLHLWLWPLSWMGRGFGRVFPCLGPPFTPSPLQHPSPSNRESLKHVYLQFALVPRPSRMIYVAVAGHQPCRRLASRGEEL